MADSIQEMTSRGQRKLEAKSGQMAQNYNDAKPIMTREYNALPFGPKTKSAYAAGISRAEYRAPDAAKWARKFADGVSR